MQDSPPASPEYERGVLGEMLAHGNVAIAEAFHRIGVEADDWFYVPAHKIIYRELTAAWQSGKAIDVLGFTQRLRDRKLMGQIGGEGIIDSLNAHAPPAGSLEYYLDGLDDKRWLRFAMKIGSDICKRAREAGDDVEHCLIEVEHQLLTLSQRHTHGAKARSVKEVVGMVIESLSDPEQALGISTGFAKLDNVVGGLARYQKIVIAGRISGGKSAFAANIADSVAVIRKIKTAVFTFEMSAAQWVQRVIQIHAKISARRVVGADVDMLDVNQFTQASGSVAEANLDVIDDRLDMAGIRARCIQLKPRLAIIDYLQIVPDRRQKGENRTDQLDRMSSESKQIAHQLGITVIELSQLTFDDKAGTFKTRGSQGITADCDQLWCLEGDDDEAKEVIGKDLVIAKQRDGGRGRVHFLFDKPATRFRPRN